LTLCAAADDNTRVAVPRITKEDLRHRLEDSAANQTAAASSPPLVVLDVRLKYPYEHSTMILPGAVRVAPGAFDFASVPRDADLVLYDSDPEELVAERAADELIRAGFRAVVLAGGISAWAVAKFPVDRKSAPRPSLPAGGLSRG
jgi:rhodanese-related sulfurtransferase